MGACQFHFSKNNRWVNSVLTDPYAALPQLTGLDEVIVDAGKKATFHQATVSDD